MFLRKLGPIAVEHDGQAVDDYIQKAANAQANKGHHQKPGGAQGKEIVYKHVLC